MAKPSIEYLNARREAKAASGGTNYALRDRVQNPVDLRAADAALDTWARAMLVVDAIYADFRSFCASSSVLELDVDAGGNIPF